MITVYILVCLVVGALVLFPASTRIGAEGAARVGRGVWEASGRLWYLAAAAQVALPIAGLVRVKGIHLGGGGASAIPFLAFGLGLAQVMFMLGVAGLLVGARPGQAVARAVLAVIGVPLALFIVWLLVMMEAPGEAAVVALVGIGPVLAVGVERVGRGVVNQP